MAINNIRPMFVGTANRVITNTTTETSLLPTSFLGSQNITNIGSDSQIVGSSFRITILGAITNLLTPNITLKVKIGALTVMDTTAQPTVTITSTRSFRIEAIITIRVIGASATAIGNGSFWYNTALNTADQQIQFPAVTTPVSSFDSTITNLIDVTAQWGTASASNTLTTTHALIERIY
jgi:hypothetical protein